MAILRQYSHVGVIIFGVVSILALGADRWVENKYLKEVEGKIIPPKP